MATVKEMLADSDIFHGLPGDWLVRIGEMAHIEDYDDRDYLFIEGEEPKNIFIIQKGRVDMDVSLSPTPGLGHQVTVDTLSKGQICGWSSVMGSNVYTMSARCAEPVRVIAINGSELRLFLDNNPSIGFKVLANMAPIVVSRLRNMKMRLPIALGRKMR